VPGKQGRNSPFDLRRNKEGAPGAPIDYQSFRSRTRDMLSANKVQIAPDIR
jgi:hypothetical protein